MGGPTMQRWRRRAVMFGAALLGGQLALAFGAVPAAAAGGGSGGSGSGSRPAQAPAHVALPAAVSRNAVNTICCAYRLPFWWYQPWVVTLGDSAISGEAGRWAGNTNTDAYHVDALGPTAYYDNSTNTAEQITHCHRSKSAEAYIGGGVGGLNLACSGARTYTHFDGSDFKPGLDFYSDANGNVGQALALQQFAQSHYVNAVTVLIGANNYNFANILQTCLVDWYTSPSWWPNYCKDDSTLQSYFSPANVANQTAAIEGSLLNVRRAMRNAGYGDSSWTMLVQTYSDPVPYGSQFRYPESGFTRQWTGGCGFWNADADWANNTIVPTINNSVRNAASWSGISNIKIVDDQWALYGHRLCENTVGLLEEVGLTDWWQPNAADWTEWVSQVRTSSTCCGSPYQLQEDGHPNYWGQLALRNCLRQAYNNGSPRAGQCWPTGGLDSQDEPNMWYG